MSIEVGGREGGFPTCLSGEERGSTLPISDQLEKSPQQLTAASTETGGRPGNGTAQAKSMQTWNGPPRGSPLRGLHRPCVENEGLQRPASAAFRAPPGGNRAPGEVISRCPLGEGSDGCAKGQPDPEARPAPRHPLPRPPRCALGAVVLGPGATLRAAGGTGGKGTLLPVGQHGGCGGHHVPGAARASRHFMRKNGGRCPLAVAWGGVPWLRGGGAPTPFYFPWRLLLLLLLSLPLPSLSDSPPSLCFCYPSPRFLPSLPSPPPPALRSRRRDPGGPSRGLFPAAPASRRRVACHLSRTSNPSVRAAACRHLSPPPAAGSPTVTPRPGKPTPGRGDDCGRPRRPVLGPLCVLSPPSPGIVLPPLPRGPRCGVCAPLSSLSPATTPPRWG